MTTTLVRVPLTLAAAFAYHVSMSPPTEPAPSTADPDTPNDRRAICTTARFTAIMLTKGLYWASALTDTLILLAPYAPSSLVTTSPTHISLPHAISIPSASTLLAWIKRNSASGLSLLSSLSLPFLPALSLVTIAGTTLALTGALLRHAAYNALGQFYACRNLGPGPCKPHRGTRCDPYRPGHAHALITTGPYAFIRHPGYAGLILCTAGLVVLQLDALKVHLSSSGAPSWGISEGVGFKMRTVALGCSILGRVGVVKRIQDEERALRTRFQGQWEEWAGKVRYKLVPGVY